MAARRLSPRRIAVVLAAVAFLLALRVLPLLAPASVGLDSMPFEADEFQHVHSAWLVSLGETPYRDFFEHHTPLYYYQLAPILASIGPAESFERAREALDAGRTLAWLWTVALVLGVGAVAQRWRGGARGLVTGVVAAGFLCGLPWFWTKSLELRPDPPAVALALASVYAIFLGLGLGARAREEAAAPAPGARSLALCLAAGALFALAVLHTQKVLFLGPGLALFWLAYLGDERWPGTRRTRMRRTAAAVLGGLLPIAALSGFFALQGALAELLWFNVPFNLGWEARFSPVPFLGRLLEECPSLLGLGALGLGLAAARGLRSDRLREGDALLVALALSSVAGLFLIQEPYLQYYQLVFPFVALFASDALVVVAEAALRGGRSLVASLRRGPGSPSEGADAPGRLAPGASERPPLSSGAILVAAILAFHLTPYGKIDEHLQGGASEQSLRSVRWLMENTEPDATVFNDWPPYGVFRRHSWYYWSHQPQMLPMIPEAAKERFVRSVVDGALRPDVITDGTFVEELPPEFSRYVRRHYRPVWEDFRMPTASGADGG